MGSSTRIEFADITINPWHGCTKKSAGCANCYAERWDRRGLHGDPTWGLTAPRRIRVERAVEELNAASRRAARRGPLRVFLGSMCDVFEDRADLVEPRLHLWRCLQQLLSDEQGPLSVMVLTKRPEIMLRWAQAHGWPPGLWAGVSIENQATADERVELLTALDQPVVRWVSAGPLLGPVDLSRWRNRLDWVVASGESGRRARPCLTSWMRHLRDQAAAAGVPFFNKQPGAWREATRDERGVRGKKLAIHVAFDGRRLKMTERFDPVVGDRVMVQRTKVEAKDRTLDGQAHLAFPNLPPQTEPGRTADDVAH